MWFDIFICHLFLSFDLQTAAFWTNFHTSTIRHDYMIDNCVKIPNLKGNELTFYFMHNNLNLVRVSIFLNSIILMKVSHVYTLYVHTPHVCLALYLLGLN